MTKSELVQSLAEANPHLYQRDVEIIVTAIFEEIAAALARGDRVELRGFAAFSVKRRDARRLSASDIERIDKAAHKAFPQPQVPAAPGSRSPSS